jgi:hypothetical protein
MNRKDITLILAIIFAMVAILVVAFSKTSPSANAESHADPLAKAAALKLSSGAEYAVAAVLSWQSGDKDIARKLLKREADLPSFTMPVSFGVSEEDFATLAPHQADMIQAESTALIKVMRNLYRDPEVQQSNSAQNSLKELALFLNDDDRHLLYQSVGRALLKRTK